MTTSWTALVAVTGEASARPYLFTMRATTAVGDSTDSSARSDRGWRSMCGVLPGAAEEWQTFYK